MLRALTTYLKKITDAQSVHKDLEFKFKDVETKIDKLGRVIN